MERSLLIKFVKAARILIILYCWLKRGLLLPQVCPVETCKKWMTLDFMYPVRPKSILGVTKKSFEDIGRWPTQLCFLRNGQGLSPSEDFLASNAWLV